MVNAEAGIQHATNQIATNNNNTFANSTLVSKEEER